MRFKWKKATAAFLSTVLVLSLSACGNSSSGDSADSDTDYKYFWKIACAETSDYYMTQLAQEFLDEVSERTGGKVTGQIFANGQLGSLNDMLESLEMGNVDVVSDCFASLGAVDSLFDAFGLPYLYDDKEHQYAFWDTYFDDVSDIVAEQTNLRIVTVMDGLNRELSSTKPVESMADLKGLKVRVPTIPVYVRIWECLGAAPVPMSFSEVYTSINTGVVDGQENDLPLSISAKMFEVCPYAVITDHVAYEGTFLFNEDVFQSYPEELQQIILEVGAEITAKSRTMVADQEETALQQLEEMNITVLRPDLTEFREATSVMYGEYTHCAPIIDLVDQARNK